MLQATVERCPEGRWEMARAQPSAELGQLVVGYAGYAEATDLRIWRREVATLTVPLIISFGSAFSIRGMGGDPVQGERHGSFVAGLLPGCVDVASDGRARCVQVDLTPLGASRLLGMPMTEIAGQCVALDDLFDAELVQIRDRLAEAAGWPERLDLADRWVRQRVARTRPPSPAVVYAWQRLRDSDGRMAIGDLAREIGWSRKHLAHCFAAEIGGGPKLVARVLRFDLARRLAERSPARPDWADIAAEAGYSDQSHLVREFALMAGDTPTGYLARPPERLD
ncbi:AraC family transcriptional regulator [Oceanibacterium hippocampi]|uniref:Helix-turn-helix domain protein n=1 Tax=Oceanibacterium hippocampi TaxID=745714 RepID=A0A1Y5RJJ4_9PROT|nr:helix-turn-helix domain-containing protein [Oceanibacterium hippocampi]SLN18039.1 Helix-turn-helix domain protein [Oceanibacterium hippocampi]